MAVDAAQMINGAWCYLRDSMGVNYGGASDKQKYNAEKLYNLLRVFGYTRAAACGILGNMQVESGLSPAALSGNVAALPNNGEHFADLNNSVMREWNRNTSSGAHATGLIQWDGVDSDGDNQIAGFLNKYAYSWLDWEGQIFRLEMEYIYDPWGWGGVNGTTYRFWYYLQDGQYRNTITWANYKTFAGTPEDAADHFRINRERSSGNESGNQHRRENARYWYTYFQSTNVDVTVSGKLNAAMAYLFRDSRYTYAQYDCVSFVNKLVRARLGLPLMTNGTNSLWRNVGGNFLWWRGTLQECIDLYGGVPEGAYIWKCYPEGTPGYNRIPDQYRGDGVGNFDHIGIYTNLGLGVMQSGGYDVDPNHGGFNGVHDTRSRLNESPPWWTHVAFGNNIRFDNAQPTVDFNIINFVATLKNKRRLYPNVWKFIR